MTGVRPASIAVRCPCHYHLGSRGGAERSAALREHGATVAHYDVLAFLDEQPGLSNADLARQAFVTPQSMNQVLRELEERTG